MAGVAFYDGGDVDGTRGAFASLHEADADRSCYVAAPHKLRSSTSRCTPKRAEQLLKHVAASTAPPPKCTREFMESTKPAEPSSESRTRVLIRIGVESRLLRGGTILVVFSSFLIVFQDLSEVYSERVREA